MALPENFINYIYGRRKQVLERISRGESIDSTILLEFTRTTPVVITDGPAGLSGSVKMVGFIPRSNLITEFARKAEYYAYMKRPGSMKEVAKVLLEEFYREELLDFTILGGLEMGFKHSWENIRATGKATLLFYTPPVESYEVRCSVEVHDDPRDPYFKYLNALHDLFHTTRRRSSYPAYLFIIKEIYDNSARENGFGKKIYP